MKFSVLIDIKIPTIDAEKLSCSAMFSQKEFAIGGNFEIYLQDKFHAHLS